MFEARVPRDRFSSPGRKWVRRVGNGCPVVCVTFNRLELSGHVIINLQLVTSIILDISLTQLIQNRLSERCFDA